MLQSFRLKWYLFGNSPFLKNTHKKRFFKRISQHKFTSANPCFFNFFNWVSNKEQLFAPSVIDIHHTSLLPLLHLQSDSGLFYSCVFLPKTSSPLLSPIHWDRFFLSRGKSQLFIAFLPPFRQYRIVRYQIAFKLIFRIAGSVISCQLAAHFICNSVIMYLLNTDLRENGPEGDNDSWDLPARICY